MATYVKFELEDGTVVYVESADQPKGSSGLIPGKGEPAVPASVSFEKSVTGVRKMAAVLVQNLRDGFAEQPDEVQINFGLKASAELGSLIVSRGGMESNYNIMLRWQSKDEKDEKGEQDEKDEKEVKGKKDAKSAKAAEEEKTAEQA